MTSNFLLSTAQLSLFLCGAAVALFLCFSHTAYRKYKDYKHDPETFATDGDNVTNNPL